MRPYGPLPILSRRGVMERELERIIKDSHASVVDR